MNHKDMFRMTRNGVTWSNGHNKGKMKCRKKGSSSKKNKLNPEL